MDHYIRLGLVAAWGLFGLALFIWWWRRRGSKHYPYSERANAVLDAIRDGIDIGIIYWSKTERRYITRVVTPQSLDGYAMRGIDHTTGAPRIFKVTRIRLIQPIPPGAPKRAPSRLTLISPIAVGVGALGVAALVLFAVAMLRGHGLSSEMLPPLMPTRTMNTPPPVTRPGTNSLAITDRGTESATVPAPPLTESTVKLSRPDASAVDDFLNEPPPTVPVITNNCYVVVENHSSYKINQVAGVLQALFRYRADRALELEHSVRTLGRAVVWSGPKDRAEKFRQFLESYDISAKIEMADSNSVARVESNAVPVLPPENH